MTNLLSANFYRLARCKLFYVLLAAQALFEVMLVQSGQADLGLTNAGPDSSMFAYPTWSFLMVSALCGLFLGSGYSSGTFRNQMICGRSRSQIYLANWITALFVALCLGLTAELVGAVYGLAAWGPFQLEGWELAGYFLGTLGTVVAGASLAAAFSMSISNRSAAIVASLLVFVVLLFLGQIVSVLIAEPPTVPPMEEVQLGNITMYQPNYDAPEVPNPSYVGGPLRFPLEVAAYLLPTSQYFQFVNLAAENPWGLFGLSMLFTALTTAVGLVIFQKKDMK